ncbi:unnamed protein product [Lampetra fluviatilis]
MGPEQAGTFPLSAMGNAFAGEALHASCESAWPWQMPLLASRNNSRPSSKEPTLTGGHALWANAHGHRLAGPAWSPRQASEETGAQLKNLEPNPENHILTSATTTTKSTSLRGIGIATLELVTKMGAPHYWNLRSLITDRAQTANNQSEGRGFPRAHALVSFSKTHHRYDRTQEEIEQRKQPSQATTFKRHRDVWWPVS